MNIIIAAHPYQEHSGGVLVTYHTAKCIYQLGYNIKLFVHDPEYGPAKKAIPIINPFFNIYADYSDINDNTIVIYPEHVQFNPLNAKIVIRWQLGPWPQYITYEHDSDLIFYWASFCKDNNIQNKNLLVVPYLTPYAINKNEVRSGSCYIIKKGRRYNYSFIHDDESECLERDDITHTDIINIFNRTKYFYCYDPLCYLVNIAVCCGCIPIVHPVPGYTKKEWCNSTTDGGFLRYKNKDYMYGVAYGINDLPYAESTIDKAYQEQHDIVEFGKKTLQFFLLNMKLLSENKEPIFLNRDRVFEFRYAQSIG